MARMNSSSVNGLYCLAVIVFAVVVMRLVRDRAYLALLDIHRRSMDKMNGEATKQKAKTGNGSS
jgi:hypothetical protein